LKVESGTNGRTFLKGTPVAPPDVHDTVIKLELGD